MCLARGGGRRGGSSSPDQRGGVRAWGEVEERGLECEVELCGMSSLVGAETSSEGYGLKRGGKERGLGRGFGHGCRAQMGGCGGLCAVWSREDMGGDPLAPCKRSSGPMQRLARELLTVVEVQSR